MDLPLSAQLHSCGLWARASRISCATRIDSGPGQTARYSLSSRLVLDPSSGHGESAWSPIRQAQAKPITIFFVEHSEVCCSPGGGAKLALTIVEDPPPTSLRTAFRRTLLSASQGDRQAAEAVVPLVYSELRKLAEARISRLAPGQTLQATALVHEAYLRLVGDEDPGWDGPAHFFGAASQAMRQIVVEKCRSKKRKKRGGDVSRADVSIAQLSASGPHEEVLAIHEALQLLEKEDPRKGRVVTLRYFGGLNTRETAKGTGTVRANHRTRMAVFAGLVEEQAGLGRRLLDPGGDALGTSHHRAEDRRRQGGDTGRVPSGPSLESLPGFQVLGEIGRGAMGVVYEAEQLDPRRRVALKVLARSFTTSGDVQERFRREAQAGQLLDHPGVVAAYSFGEHQGLHYIVQELVPGGRTLADRVADLRRQPEVPEAYYRQVAETARQVAGALEAAHGLGIIHRDVKPANILITPDGNPKVTDFGIAKIEDALTLSLTGDVLGTPFYMSPEQVRARRGGVDARSDIFSLGATLYELLTLSRPFGGDAYQQVLKRILEVDPVPPHRLGSRVPRDLSIICLKALEKRPADRYASMAEFASDLERYLQGRPIVATPPGGMRIAARWMRRHPTASTSIGLVCGALVICSGLLVQTLEAKESARETATLAEARASQAALEREKAERARERVLQLSDHRRLDRLHSQAEELWPALPHQVPAYEDWLQRATRLVNRLPAHEAFLEELLRPRAPPGVSLNRQEEDWWIETLQGLVRRIHELQGTGYGTISDLQARLRSAQTLHQRSIVDHEELWNEAIAEIALNETYGGLEIAPQIGLVPIGKDRQSGLWEFWHVESGVRPRRDSRTGKLEISVESGIVLVLLPGGRFWMGAQKSDPGHRNYDPAVHDDDEPPHEIKLSPFFLAKYELRQSTWLRIMGTNPSRFVSFSDHLLRPVELMNWFECREALRRMNLRLPTEAQWEYAFRAGTTSPWPTGQSLSDLEGHGNLPDRTFAAQFWPTPPSLPWDDGHGVTAPVGSYPPSSFGLHDMLGNVQEWCQDWMGSYDLPARGEDGLRLASSKWGRSLRGGSYIDEKKTRSAARWYYEPHYRFDYVGVRPARAVD